ncbi:hypothetical protein LMG9585_22585, partial [Xanthomonas oryzae pv. oryzae]
GERSTAGFEFGDAHSAKELYQPVPAHPELRHGVIECLRWVGVALEKTKHAHHVREVGNVMGRAFGNAAIDSSDQFRRVRQSLFHCIQGRTSAEAGQGDEVVVG